MPLSPYLYRHLRSQIPVRVQLDTNPYHTTITDHVCVLTQLPHCSSPILIRYTYWNPSLEWLTPHFKQHPTSLVAWKRFQGSSLRMALHIHHHTQTVSFPPTPKTSALPYVATSHQPHFRAIVFSATSFPALHRPFDCQVAPGTPLPSRSVATTSLSPTTFHFHPALLKTQVKPT